MQLINDFSIPAGADQAWAVLTDLQRVVPCLPGASLDTLDDAGFTGRMAIKLGPMSLRYAGSGTLRPDPDAQRIVVDANGGEQRGGGNANATITATLQAVDPTRTQVRVETDLALSGRPAQFGRGIMMEVAGRMLDSFATNLAQELSTVPTGEPASDSPAAPAIDRAAAEPLDLAGVGLVPVLKRAVPVVAAALVVAAWVIRTRRRS